MACIMVVDDDDLSRIYLSELLKRAGYTVQEAGSGLECLEQVARHHIDLFITDIFMPMMDGLELLSLLLKERPDHKIIAMSGGGSGMSQSLALDVAEKLGAIGLISKPFKMNEVIHTVASVLQEAP
ncbi:MAG: response regulator [Magnetococcales bacterium]|nr:response regulator [Magnetococcales bacterium]